MHVCCLDFKELFTQKSTSIRTCNSFVEYACEGCKKDMADIAQNNFLHLAIGPTEKYPVKSPRYKLRDGRGGNIAYIQRLRACLGNSKLDLIGLLKLLETLKEFLSNHDQIAIDSQIAHLSMSRYSHHSFLCKLCTAGSRACDNAKYGPIYIGKDGVTYLDIWLKENNIELENVIYAITDSKSCIPFKFDFFVRPFIETTNNPFVETLTKVNPHSLKFTHICICTFLFDAFRTGFKEGVTRGLSYEIAIQLGCELALHSTSFVYVKSMQISLFYKCNGTCKNLLNRYGVYDLKGRELYRTEVEGKLFVFKMSHSKRIVGIICSNP